MRLLFAASLLLIIGLFTLPTPAQDKTIVLVRHAERNPPTPTDKGDPDLSPEGKARAERLWKIVKKYKPHEIFATEYKRTQQTVEQIARRRGKQVQTYDSAKTADLVAQMMASKTEHYLIAGHSNTIPVFANLLMKKEVFKQLPETEFGVVWVVRIRKGVLKEVKVLSY
jgi:2,3-bisphosphoglycerate-dependent phosphoglycerate mutase